MGGKNEITLSYRHRDRWRDEWQTVNQRVPIVWTPCRFGGSRPWFHCVCTSNGRYCGRKVAKLYGAGRLFACRHCYRLVYGTQRGHALDQSHARLAKIYRKLGADYGCFGQALPPRPKGMRWRTYDRLCEQLEAAETKHNAIFCVDVARLLARPDRDRH
jgi:hypothetical protein